MKNRPINQPEKNGGVACQKWMMTGIGLGIGFSLMTGSMVVGVAMGLIAAFFAAIINERILRLL